MTRCPEPGAWVELDALAGDARVALLGHASQCGACRERLLAGDPARVFALLALRPIPQPSLDRVANSVASALDAGDLGAPARSFRALAVGWAAAALLAVAVAGVLTSSPHAPRLGDEPADLALSASPLGAPRAGVEVLSSPGAARVVDLAVGETQVVMIFDERLDL